MKKFLTFILAIIFAMNIFIVPISAQTQNQNTSTNQEEINEDENNTINQEVQTTTKEDEKKEGSDTNKETEKQSNQETENSQKTQNQNDSVSSQNNLTEEKDITNDDPQQFRANGDISDEFYSTGPMARSTNSGFNLKSPYDNKTYTHNSKFKDYNVTYGIDVSYWNGTINWQKVKNDGIKYAFIRVGYRGYGKMGTIDNDSTFKRNITEAKKYGIKVGVYFFSQAITTAEARQEANYTLKQIKGYGLDMPVVIDYEYAGGSDGRLTNANLSKTAATNIVMEFCKTVKNAGYTPMVYANYSMLNYDLNKSTIDSTYKVWLAHYTSSTSYSGKYEFWQHTSSGSVDGISGRVDINVWYTPKSSEPSISTPKLTFYSSSDNAIKLTWNKISNATGYRIYRYNSKTKKYDVLKDITSGSTTNYTDSKRSSATTYIYKIRSFYTDKSGSRIYSSASSATYATTDPKKVSGLKVTTTYTNKINLTWSKVYGASGYRIYKYNSKSKTYVYLATVKGNTYQDKKVSKNKTYYYKVRAYRTLSGKNYYGSYSSSLKAKAVLKTYLSMTKKTAKVKALVLNVRSNAGTSSKRITTITYNKKVTAYGYKNDSKGKRWYKITFKKGKKTYYGYVHSKYLKF
ncbi:MULTISPECIES: GH25 family lysozyme [Anaerofustis]|uniref:GH25 family lysozyme n=1 Tax=Anaerofustis TaxID=264995 RepID=UPI001105B2C7|nr:MULTISPECIES: GH25 family lysozyme [Anaerofustis]MCO8193980.1 SH3 domain-containing protein [Anaerofustis sp. NSJ-163]